MKTILRLSDQRADQVTDELMEAVRRTKQTKVISFFSLCPGFFASQSFLLIYFGTFIPGTMFFVSALSRSSVLMA